MTTRAVIFDYDDTLVKTREIKWRQFQAVARDTYGINLTEDVLRQHWGKPYDQIHRLYFKDADTLENMIAAKLARESEFPVELQPGALETVSRLRRKGIVLAILSSSSQRVVAPDLWRLGFDLSDFAYIQTSEATTVHKPDPAVFAPVLKHIGVDGPSVIYVGDALSDYQAATAVGLRFVGVTTGTVSSLDFSRAGADAVITTLTNLKSYV
jgi:HAD superfamily hydrolase (TIGR01549 family)